MLPPPAPLKKQSTSQARHSEQRPFLASSRVMFPPPSAIRKSADVVPVEVDPGVAFAVQLRQCRMRNHLTQKETARQLRMRNLYSYQRLERRSNPSLSTLMRVKRLFPDFSLDSVIGG